MKKELVSIKRTKAFRLPFNLKDLQIWKFLASKLDMLVVEIGQDIVEMFSLILSLI